MLFSSAGSKMVLWNMSSRNLPKGIQVGQDGKPLVLKINDEFESVSHYGVPCVFHRMEVGLACRVYHHYTPYMLHCAYHIQAVKLFTVIYGQTFTFTELLSKKLCTIKN